MHVNELLKLAVEAGASDLHLKVGSYPMMRVRGELAPASEIARLSHEDTVEHGGCRHVHAAAAEVQGQPRNRPCLQRARAGPLPLQRLPAARDDRPGPARHSGWRQRRRRPGAAPVLKDDRLRGARPRARDWHHRQRQVHHPGGARRPRERERAAATSSRSRTRSNSSTATTARSINQREVSVDTRSFAHALRSALRQDPDVILVGEMRDYETIETALHAAETGHLVFSTLHTLDATETINRIIAVFPPHQQKQIRMQIASVLRAVVSQRLMPRADGKGRVAAVRSDDHDAVHPRLHRRQGKNAPDPVGHRRRHVAVRHADVRPGHLQPLRPEAGHLRRGAALGDEQGRVQAPVQGISTTSDETRDQMARSGGGQKKPGLPISSTPQVTRFGR